MTNLEPSSPRETKRYSQRQDAAAVLAALADFCGDLQPGAVVPPHQELMKQLGASERAVRWALDELRREGAIVRRQGAGTFVADRAPALTGHEIPGEGAELATSPTSSRTVVAIGIPDHAVFDQAMKQLFHQCEDAELNLVCRFVDVTSANAPAMPAAGEAPLGFVLFRRDLLPYAEKLQEAGHRVVLVGAPAVDEIPNVPCIYGEHEEGGYLATKLLLDLGHRRIAYCGSPSSLESRRYQGFQRAVREARRQGKSILDSQLLIQNMREWKNDPAAGHAALRGPLAPTGLLLWNDHEAVAIMGVLARLGISVPADVSLVGYDNLTEGQLVHPPLTTVYSPIDQQLKAAIALLTRPAAPPHHYQMVVMPTLICRESTAPWAS